MCLFVICLFLILMDGASGNGFGSCPKYPSLPRFNMRWVMGEWYVVEKSFHLPEVLNGCTILAFNPLNSFKLEVTIKTVNRITGNPTNSSGYATLENTKSSTIDFQITSSLPDFMARLLPGSGKYQVLETDHNTFAILYSCGSIGPIAYFDQIWLLGRDRNFTAELRQNMYDTLKKLGLEPNRLSLSNNDYCP